METGAASAGGFGVTKACDCTHYQNCREKSPQGFLLKVPSPTWTQGEAEEGASGYDPQA
jgi:hypothetical protein